MKSVLHIFVTAYAAMSIASCSSNANDGELIFDTRPNFTISELQGTWTATIIIFSYSEADNAPDPAHANIIAEGGSGSLTVESGGRFSLVIDPTDRPAFTINGRMFFEDREFLAIQFDGDPAGDYEYYGARLIGNTFKILGGPGTAEYDLDLDGTDDLCSVSLEFIKA